MMAVRRAASGWIVPNGDSDRIELAGFNSPSPYWPQVTHWWLFSMPPYPS